MNIESNKALWNLLHNQTQFLDGAGKEDEVVIVEDAVKKYIESFDSLQDIQTSITGNSGFIYMSLLKGNHIGHVLCFIQILQII